MNRITFKIFQFFLILFIITYFGLQIKELIDFRNTVQGEHDGHDLRKWAIRVFGLLISIIAIIGTLTEIYPILILVTFLWALNIASSIKVYQWNAQHIAQAVIGIIVYILILVFVNMGESKSDLFLTPAKANQEHNSLAP